MPGEERLTDWVCTVTDGKTVRLEDIPGTDWGPLEAETGDSWFQLAAAPLATSTRAMAVYRYCCRRVHEEPRDLTGGELWDVFNRVEDDRPTMYDGGLPDPKAGEQTTV